MPLFTPNNNYQAPYVGPQIMQQPQYQQIPQPITQPTIPQAQSNSSSISWVQGEAGAKAYPVAAGNTVLLLDSEESVFYLKSTDTSGMPQPLRVFEFKERKEQHNEKQQKVNMDDYVTKDEFDDLADKFEILLKRLDRPEKEKRERRIPRERREEDE